MLVSEVHVVLDALRAVGCPHWVEGGWGIDALVGHQTREHRDVDIDVDSTWEARALEVLAGLGYVVETDWRPNRVELVAPGRGWVDLHPVEIDSTGRVRQAALGGGWHEFVPNCFTVGSIEGVEVPCFTVAAQRHFHSGYELRPVDHLDLAHLDGRG